MSPHKIRGGGCENRATNCVATQQSTDCNVDAWILVANYKSNQQSIIISFVGMKSAVISELVSKQGKL